MPSVEVARIQITVNFAGDFPSFVVGIRQDGDLSATGRRSEQGCADENKQFIREILARVGASFCETNPMTVILDENGKILA